MNRLNRCKPLLGTFVEVSVWGNTSDDTLIELSNAAFAEIKQVEALMSFHRADSELSNLNRNAFRRPCRVSARMMDVLQQALALSCLSNGLYDITVAPELIAQKLLPDIGLRSDEYGCWSDILLCGNRVRFARALLLDLGGIAKGYAVDRAVDRALAVTAEVREKEPEAGINLSVNAGGDLRVSHWRDYSVSIRHPAVHRGELLPLRMRAPAVATSANYFVGRGAAREPDAASAGRAAVICPKARTAVNRDYSVSVFASTCMLADALTKIVYLDPGCDQLLRTLGAQAVILDQEGRATWIGQVSGGGNGDGLSWH